MGRSAKRILVALDPGFLEGALATLLEARFNDEVVQQRTLHAMHDSYDAAVVSDELPDGVRADVVITLPDTRGSSGMGTVRTGTTVHEVTISSADQVVELLEQYAP